VRSDEVIILNIWTVVDIDLTLTVILTVILTLINDIDNDNKNRHPT
jgi:hypothetical protein